MSRLPYMPLFVGDLLRDTPHLSNEQFGAYMRLIMAGWTAPIDGLPDDDRQLARICHCGLHKWRRNLRPALASFFTIGAGLWVQERVKKERHIAKIKSTKLSANAHKRWNKNNGIGDADAGASAYADGDAPIFKQQKKKPSAYSSSAASRASAASAPGGGAASRAHRKPPLDLTPEQWAEELRLRRAAGLESLGEDDV